MPSPKAGFVLRFRRTGSRPFGLSRCRPAARCGGDLQDANEGTLVTGAPSIMSAPAEIQGAGLRANPGNDGMAFRQGVADDQPSGSARCNQTRTFMFDLDRHWCERRGSRRYGLEKGICGTKLHHRMTGVRRNQVLVVS